MSLPTLGVEPYKPKLTDGKSPDFQDFPMGVLSATGRLHKEEREIVVRDVGKGGVAEEALIACLLETRYSKRGRGRIRTRRGSASPWRAERHSDLEVRR